MFEWDLLAAADHDDLDDDAEYGDDHVSTDIGDYGADEVDEDDEEVADKKEGDVAAHTDHPAPAHSHGGKVGPQGPADPGKRAKPRRPLTLVMLLMSCQDDP